MLKEKKRLEGELEALTKKTHDASGQLVLISQELLKKERSVCRAGCVCVCVCSECCNHHWPQLEGPHLLLLLLPGA